MSDEVEGRVICDARAHRCRCHKDAGHVDAGDDVHACPPDRCTGSWTGDYDSGGVDAGGTFQIVTLPHPVGERAFEPWPDDGPEDAPPPTGGLPLMIPGYGPVTVRRGGIRYGEQG